MSADTQTKDAESDIGHEIGEHNVEVFGLDIHNPVFAISAIVAIVIIVLTLLFQEQAGGILSDFRAWTTSTFDWVFMISANLFVLFCLGMIVTPLGRIRLGGIGAKPRYGYPGWLAMLFAAGVGIGLMFFGVLEPVTHTLNPPLGVDPADTDTARSACPRPFFTGDCTPGPCTPSSACRSRSSASIEICP